MTNKIKLFFTFLAVIAVLSVLSFFDILSGVQSAKLGDAVVPLPPLSDDADQDGLSDTDESYWGTDFKNPDTDGDNFLDGEETASGHDPLKVAPNDILLNSNISQRTSDLVIAGLVEGSLKPGSPNYEESLNELASYIVEGAVTDLSPSINLGDIKIIEPTKENQIVYTKEVGGVIKDLVDQVNKQAVGLMSNSQELFIPGDDTSEPDQYFLRSSNEFKDMYNLVFSLPVPKNWKKYHITLLASLDQLTKTNETLAYRANDPVNAAVAYTLWDAAYDSVSGLIQSFADKITEEKLIENQSN